MSELKQPQINSVVLSGRTVHSAKMSKSTGGKSIAKFSIAVDRGFGEKKEVSFFDCVAFDKTAEFVERDCGSGHGVPVLVEGTIQQRRWEDKEGGKRSAVEIVVNRFSCLAWPDKDGDQKSRRRDEEPAQEPESDLPF